MRVNRSSTGGGPTSAAAKVNNENEVIPIVTDDAGNAVTGTGTAILRSAQRKLFRIVGLPF